MDYLLTLRQLNFLKLWVAQISSIVAQNLLNFALIILVFNETQGSSYSALLVLSFGLPAILFASLAGEYADIWDRRLVMVVSNLLRSILVLGYIFIEGQLWLILLLSFVVSTVMQFFIPAEAATIPRVVPKEKLITANSLFISSFYTSFLLGNILAAPTIKYFGSTGPFVVTSILFGLSAVVAATLPKQPPIHTQRGERRPPAWREAFASWEFIRKNPDLRFPLVQLTITQAIVSVILALAPALSVALLKAPLQQSSEYFILPVGLGLVAGVAAVSVLSRRRSRVRILEVGLVIAGMALTALGLTGLLYRTFDGRMIVPAERIALIVAVLVFTLGMLNAIISVLAQTQLQEESRDDTRGKVFGSLNLLINLAATFPILVAGVLADILSVTKVIALMGAAMVIFAVWQLRRSYTAQPVSIAASGRISRRDSPGE